MNERQERHEDTSAGGGSASPKNTAPLVDSKPEPQNQPRRDLFAYMGWVLGATSLLNLAQDIGKLAVYGKLKTWLDAYSSFVKTIGDFLCGWINWRWMSISESEYHLLVIGLIFWSACVRAGDYVGIDGSTEGKPTILFVKILSIFVPLLLLPGLVGFLVAAIILVAGIADVLWEKDHSYEQPRSKDVQHELLGVVGIFLLFVAFNYSVFAPH